MSQIDGEKFIAENWSVWPDSLPSLQGDWPGPADLVLLPDEPDAAPWELGVPPEMRPNVAKALACADLWMEGKLGRASRGELRLSFEALLVWACHKHDAKRGTFDQFAAALFASVTYGRFVEKNSSRNLRRELRDERDRDRIGKKANELGPFVAYWRGRLDSEIRKNRAAWHIPEMAADDAREAMLLELTEAMMVDCSRVEFFARPGCEATYRFLASAKDSLRARRRIYIAEATFDLFPDMQPSAEALLIAAEEGRAIAALPLALKAIRPGLTKPAAQWLSALQLEANGPEERLNLARAAQNLDRHRSGAVRAIQVVRAALEASGYTCPWDESGRR